MNHKNNSLLNTLLRKQQLVKYFQNFRIILNDPLLRKALRSMLKKKFKIRDSRISISHLPMSRFFLTVKNRKKIKQTINYIRKLKGTSKNAVNYLVSIMRRRFKKFTDNNTYISASELLDSKLRFYLLSRKFL